MQRARALTFLIHEQAMLVYSFFDVIDVLPIKTHSV